MYCIYLHRNKANGLVYVGQTKYGNNPNKRWQNGTGYEKNTRFFSDIVKYGWDNFDHIILDYCFTQEDANIKEKSYIKLFNANNPSNGYNLTQGGSNIKPVKINKPWYNDAKGILRSYK